MGGQKKRLFRDKKNHARTQRGGNAPGNRKSGRAGHIRTAAPPPPNRQKNTARCTTQRRGGMPHRDPKAMRCERDLHRFGRTPPPPVMFRCWAGGSVLGGRGCREQEGLVTLSQGQKQKETQVGNKRKLGEVNSGVPNWHLWWMKSPGVTWQIDP